MKYMPNARAWSNRTPLVYKSERKIVSLAVAMLAGIGLLMFVQFVTNRSPFVFAGEKSIAFRNAMPIIFGAGFGFLMWSLEVILRYFFDRGEKMMVAPIREEELAQELACNTATQRQSV